MCITTIACDILSTTPTTIPHIARLQSSMPNTKCALPPWLLTELSAVVLETQEPQHAATHEQDS